MVLALGEDGGCDQLVGEADGALVILGRPEAFVVGREEIKLAVFVFGFEDLVAVARMSVAVGGIVRPALFAAEVGGVAVGTDERRVGRVAVGGVAVDEMPTDAFVEGSGVVVVGVRLFAEREGKWHSPNIRGGIGSFRLFVGFFWTAHLSSLSALMLGSAGLASNSIIDCRQPGPIVDYRQQSEGVS